MYILGIESSASISAVCLAEGREPVAEYHFRHDMGLLRRLVPEIENLLQSAGTDASGLGAVAVSLGPGSFTGLRIGLSCAKAMAYALDIPLVGVPTLKAIARNIGCIGEDCRVCSMVFARADEVYYCIYDHALNELCGYSIDAVSNVLENPLFASGTIIFAGSGCRRHKDAITAAFGKRALFADIVCDFPRGLSVISLACDRLERGERDDAAALVPMYIKKPTPVIRKENAK
ncbi:MAG: tRNA (adenosine(37)-N6)-threonylcarbamoyltransferase complex dimerization subunit type 1 TsaB [Abditibacteriota bacterium]|nr:tRNA (adenosine(37)-N6)-threonylcarbamoyltransferase complex dimerization subunit type 1 TsaB [Abditibacteriota bacterium]